MKTLRFSADVARCLSAIGFQIVMYKNFDKDLDFIYNKIKEKALSGKREVTISVSRDFDDYNLRKKYLKQLQKRLCSNGYSVSVKCGFPGLLLIKW